MPGITEFVDQSLISYNSGRFQVAFALALISVDATARKRYPSEDKESAKRFRKFVNEEALRYFVICKHTVDAPSHPPSLKLPTPPPIGGLEWKQIIQFLENQRKLADDHLQELSNYLQQYKDVGDDFKKDLGQPRLVTTTGILYEARCQLVHQANLSSVRLVEPTEDNLLSVSGGDPIQLSTTWILKVLEIAKGAKENQQLFT